MMHTHLRLAAALLVGVALAGLGSRSVLAADRGVFVHDRDRVTGEITAGDEDAFDLNLAEGGTLQVALSCPKGTKLVPKLALYRPDGEEFDLWGLVHGAGGPSPRTSRIVVPAGQTGRWQVRVTGANGTTGTYTITPRVALPSSLRSKGIVLTAGVPVELPFAGDSGARVRYSVKRVTGSLPAGVRVLDPDGLGVPESSVTPKPGKKSLKSGTILLGQGFGPYSLVLDPAADGDATEDVVVTVDMKGMKPVTTTLPPESSITSVSPGIVRQDGAGLALEVHGTGLLAGSTAQVDGEGVTVKSLDIDDAGVGHLVVDVASDAPYGLRRVVLLPPEALGESTAFEDAITVQAPDPTITSASFAGGEQGAGETEFDVVGTGFRPGGTISVSGTGLVIGPTEILSATLARASIAITASAPVGPRNVTYTQAADGGGAAATLTGAFDVSLPGPAFTSITPSVVRPTDSHVILRIVGNYFNQGTTTFFSGSGITVHSTAYVNNNTIDVDVSVAADAATGPRSVTITPAAGGGPAHKFTDKLNVAAAAPFVASFSHGTLAPGATFSGVTVRGQNFRAGDTLTASGSGVTFSGTTVIGPTEISTTATVAGGTATGLRNLTVAHSAADGGLAATLTSAFRITGAVPTITAVSPGIVGVTGAGGATRDVPMTITGTNFVTGAGVTITRNASSGVTVTPGSVTVVSNTRIDLTISLTGTATAGLWSLNVANPGSLGNSGSTGNDLLDVKSSTTLAVNRVISSSGGPFGGEHVTVQGSGFADGCTLDFGAVRAVAMQVVDAGTIVATVPRPAVVSNTTTTSVGVTVTAPSAASVTLANGYTYDRDTQRFVTVRTIPAQGATGVMKNLKSAVVVLSAPANIMTGVYGTATGYNTFWYETNGNYTTGGQRGFGPGGRFLVFTRSTGGNLGVLSQGVYVLDIPTTLWSLGGNPFKPTRLDGASNHDQQSFTLHASATDTTAPTLSTIAPANGATGQETTSKVVLTFSEELSPLTVSLSTITFQKSGVTVPAIIELSDDLKTVTITPEAELAVGTTYTTTVTTNVQDLCGNAMASVTRTFTTGNGTDTVKPSVDAVAIESLPASVDGSGTYVNSGGAGGKPFDVYLPRDGWLLDVTFSDAGGSGVDPSTFSAKCSATVGSYGANAELASNFTVTSTGASWRIPATAKVAVGEDITFTFLVKDRSGNTANAKTVTVDIVDKDTGATGGGDHDPIDSRRTWVLRADIDAFTTTFTSTATPTSQRGATTTVVPNGIPDLDEALRLIGLNSASMTPAAASAVNGSDTGTNAIVRRVFLERLRELMNQRFGIADDGTHGADSIDIEFLLPGEQGSLATWPVYSTSGAQSSGKAFSEISISGTVGADTSAYTTGNKLGDAWYDPRNLHEEANINTGSASDAGVFLLAAFKLEVNSNTLFKSKISSKLVAIHGGVPVGEDASDDDILKGSFDRTTSADATMNLRYDQVMDAVEYAALYVSAITAHEIGHSLGLVPDGPPKTGLFGAAHYSNTFTEATSASPNTATHLDFLGNDLMAASTNFDATTYTGADFKRFSPMDAAFLRNRLLHDEGK